MSDAPSRVPGPPAAALPETAAAEEEPLDLQAIRTVVEEQVRKRPILSVAAALTFGFLLGRLLRS